VIALLWAAAGAALLAAVVLLVRRSRHEPVLQLADSSSFGAARRRTRMVWASLAAAILAVLIVFAVQARAQPEVAPILSPGSDAVIVVDLSGSALASSEGISRVLLALTQDPRRHLGLVVFSDTAYEALPPSTPVDGLKGWLDQFRRGTPWEYPWSPSFASGTVISTGLVLARKLLRRDHVARPHVILVSDLADADPDLQRLAEVVAQYQREHIDLRVIKVSPGTTPATDSVTHLPNADFVADAASQIVDPTRSSGSDPLPIVLAVLVCCVGALAAVNELTLHPLTWRRT
jgi:VWA domain containing CoxE-like protein